MTREELLRKHRADILQVAAKYGAKKVRIFGSVARGEADEDSDLDFLVEMERGRSLLDLGGPNTNWKTCSVAASMSSPSRDSRRGSANAYCARLCRFERPQGKSARHSGGHRGY
ncbi:MAG: hypothetical protein KatS3mg110_2766 [Pirellulaceae bacterium]|nr:MAG: hypothetical protein KatS3mg110_2766 [Pirellulaceae bacterium]